MNPSPSPTSSVVSQLVSASAPADSATTTQRALATVSLLACSFAVVGEGRVQDQPESHILYVDHPTSPGGVGGIICRSGTPFVYVSASSVATATPTVSAALRSLREMSGLTWDQLGKLFGVSRRAVHHWASGGRMTARNADVLADLTLRFSQVKGTSVDERRAAILAPDESGYSLFDRLRMRYRTSSLDISGTPFSPGQLLENLND
jgi:transcriptional regulator with XRE-family HTH domain